MAERVGGEPVRRHHGLERRHLFGRESLDQGEETGEAFRRSKRLDHLRLHGLEGGAAVEGVTGILDGDEGRQLVILFDTAIRRHLAEPALHPSREAETGGKSGPVLHHGELHGIARRLHQGDLHGLAETRLAQRLRLWLIVVAGVVILLRVPVLAPAGRGGVLLAGGENAVLHLKAAPVWQAEEHAERLALLLGVGLGGEGGDGGIELVALVKALLLGLAVLVALLFRLVVGGHQLLHLGGAGLEGGEFLAFGLAESAAALRR